MRSQNWRIWIQKNTTGCLCVKQGSPYTNRFISKKTTFVEQKKLLFNNLFIKTVLDKMVMNSLHKNYPNVVVTSVTHTLSWFRYTIADLEGGRYFFNAVREGDSIIYASDDENECHLWVMAMYRATGQSHKPTPPLTLQDKNSTISKIQGGKTPTPYVNLFCYGWNFVTDADRARKHGMEDFISADPCQFDHASLFKLLQNFTLEYRLNDPYCSLVCINILLKSSMLSIIIIS